MTAPVTPLMAATLRDYRSRVAMDVARAAARAAALLRTLSDSAAQTAPGGDGGRRRALLAKDRTTGETPSSPAGPALPASNAAVRALPPWVPGGAHHP